jgi:hypothetical protein
MLCVRVGFEMPNIITFWYIIKVDFCMQNLTPKIKIFILCVVLIIANNIDQKLKVEITTKVKFRLKKCNQKKKIDNSKNLLGQNMEGYKSIFGFNLNNEWVRHNNIGCRN